MKRLIPFTLLLLSMSVTSCKQKYAQGFDDGARSRDADVTNAYNDGYDDGSADAWEEAQEFFANADYNQGFADGEAVGYDNGYSDGTADGYDLGYGDGLTDGYDLGYDDGIDDGYDLGYGDGFGDGAATGGGGYTQGDLNNAYDDGYGDGYGDGLDDGLSGSATAIADAYDDGYGDGYGDGYDDGDYDGYNSGINDGYDLGFDDGYDYGFDDGYTVGYDDGYYDGYWGLSTNGKVVTAAAVGLPHNNAKNLNPKVMLANTLANDLIDFSKMAKAEASMLKELENKTLAFDETAQTSKDIQKLAAVKEQFRLQAASEQIKAKFGLSADASKKIAVLAHSYRKSASTRAITEKDSQAFSKQLIGADLKEVEVAYKKAMKGEFSNLKSLVEKAASVNKTSPEKMAKVMFELFI